MFELLCVAVAVSAALAIHADRGEVRRRRFYLFKPLTTLLVIGVAALAPDSGYRTLILLGLLLSLAGDIALMGHSNASFVAGLSSFLLAHLLFIAALLSGIELHGLPWLAWGFVLYGVAFASLLLPRAGRLRIPVLLYGLILTAMGVSATIRWETLGDTGSLLAWIGAAAFVISDSALGARRFLGPYRGAQALILSTYWAAILLIAVSAQFVSG